jgi:nucleoid-associated protein YgaU
MMYDNQPATGTPTLERFNPSNESVTVPSVYLRPNGNPEQPQQSATAPELDVLWSNQHKPLKEGASPLLLFGSGFLAGLLTYALAGFLFAGNNSVLTQWIKLPSSGGVVAPQANKAVEADNTSTSTQPTPTATQSAQPAQGENAANSTTALVKGQAYKVQSGDSLGSIANKFYGSSAPEMVSRIMKANNLSNPNRLSLGQPLVIPPKNY